MTGVSPTSSEGDEQPVACSQCGHPTPHTKWGCPGCYCTAYWDRLEQAEAERDRLFGVASEALSEATRLRSALDEIGTRARGVSGG